MAKQNFLLNALAAFNTFGVEYDANSVGFNPVSREKFDNIPEEDVIEKVTFSSFGKEEKEFLQKWEEFQAFTSGTGCWSKPTGYCAAEIGGKYVAVVFDRTYCMSSQDWEDYAAWCGASCPEEAQCNYGDPTPARKYFAVFLHGASLDRLVQLVAKDCWA